MGKIFVLTTRQAPFGLLSDYFSVYNFSPVSPAEISGFLNKSFFKKTLAIT